MRRRIWQEPLFIAGMLFGVVLLGLHQHAESQQTVVTGNTATILRDTTFNIPQPSTTDAGKWQAHYSDTVQVYRVQCTTDGLGQVTINFEIRPESSPNTSGTSVLAADLTCTGSGASTTTILNNTIPATLTAGYIVTAIITGTTGTPGMLRASVITQ